MNPSIHPSIVPTYIARHISMDRQLLNPFAISLYRSPPAALLPIAIFRPAPPFHFLSQYSSTAYLRQLPDPRDRTADAGHLDDDGDIDDVAAVLHLLRCSSSGSVNSASSVSTSGRLAPPLKSLSCSDHHYAHKSTISCREFDDHIDINDGFYINTTELIGSTEDDQFIDVVDNIRVLRKRWQTRGDASNDNQSSVDVVVVPRNSYNAWPLIPTTLSAFLHHINIDCDLLLDRNNGRCDSRCSHSLQLFPLNLNDPPTALTSSYHNSPAARFSVDCTSPEYLAHRISRWFSIIVHPQYLPSDSSLKDGGTAADDRRSSAREDAEYYMDDGGDGDDCNCAGCTSHSHPIEIECDSRQRDNFLREPIANASRYACSSRSSPDKVLQQKPMSANLKRVALIKTARRRRKPTTTTTATSKSPNVNRDLFKTTYFQLCELLVAYPFQNYSIVTTVSNTTRSRSRSAAATAANIKERRRRQDYRYMYSNSSSSNSNTKSWPWKSTAAAMASKEALGELSATVNRVAVGLAGAGLALILFVASRMLGVNATLDGTKLSYLMRGMGLIWLSSALNNLAYVAPNHLRSLQSRRRRHSRNASSAIYMAKVKAVTFRVCFLVILTMIRLA